MILFASGPRGNGTSLLYRILTTADVMPLHVPAFPAWTRQTDWSQDFPTALFVVIQRDWFVAARSMVARGLHTTLAAALAEQDEARHYLFDQSDHMKERCFYVSYEGLVDAPERTVRAITKWLRSKGYTGKALTLPEPIRDENAKWAA